MAGTSINVARLEKLLGMMVVRADKAGQLVGIPLREVRRAFARKGEREAPLRTWYAFQRWVKKEGWCVFTGPSSTSSPTSVAAGGVERSSPGGST